MTGDSTNTLPWDQDIHGGGTGGNGEDRQQRAQGGMRGGRGCQLLKTKGARIAITCAVNPRTGLLHAALSITRRRDRHQVITGVSTLSAGWEPGGAPSCPGSRFAGGRIARPWAGMDPGRLSGPGRRLSPGPAVALPPQRSRAAGPAKVGPVPSSAPLCRFHPVHPES